MARLALWIVSLGAGCTLVNPDYLGLDGGTSSGVSAGTVAGSSAGTVAGGSASGTTSEDLDSSGALETSGGSGTTVAYDSSGSQGSSTGVPLHCGDGPDQACFGDAVTFPTFAGEPRGIDAADFDADGAVDIIVTHFGSNAVQLFSGDGSGILAGLAPVFHGSGVGPVAVVFAELDGTAPLDAVTADRSGDTLTVFLGGGGSVTPAATYDVGGRVEDCVVGDFNGDTNVDVAAPNRDGDTVALFFGDGLGGLSDAVEFDVGDQPESIARADLDGDGDLDLITGNVGGDSVSVLVSDGPGSFVVQTYPVGSRQRGVAAADVNEDGSVDALTSFEEDSAVGVFMGDGAGGIVLGPMAAVDATPSRLAVGDANGDGHADVAVVVDAAELSLLLGDGSGGFTKVRLMTNNKAGDVVFTDLNGDGFDDLVATIPSVNELAVFVSEPT